MDKDQLLYELQSNTFVRLKPSPLHGIGVFAIRNIPKGCKDMFTHEQGEWHKLRMEELENLPESSRQLIDPAKEGRSISRKRADRSAWDR